MEFIEIPVYVYVFYYKFVYFALQQHGWIKNTLRTAEEKAIVSYVKTM